MFKIDFEAHEKETLECEGTKAKIVSWNVRGLNDHGKKRIIKRQLLDCIWSTIWKRETTGVLKIGRIAYRRSRWTA